MKKILVRIGSLVIVVVLSLVFIVRTPQTSATVPGVNVLVSENFSGNGQGGDGWSNPSILSKNGKVAVYVSSATNLIANDTNGVHDIFAMQIDTGVTTRISVSTLGVEANEKSEVLAVSETGRYITFRSKAGNLIDGINNSPYSNYRTYIRDTSVSTTTEFLPARDQNYHVITSISNDGRYILTQYLDANVRRYDLWTGSMLFINQGDYNGNGVMSCDGSFVAFDSEATDITPNDTNGKRDVFLADLRDSSIRYTNITEGGNEDSNTGVMSCNGNFIGIATSATNLGSGHSSTYRQYYSYDRINGSFVLLTQSSAGVTQNSDAPTALLSSLSLSDKGDAVFKSNANNLVSGYSSGGPYLRSPDAGTTEVLAKHTNGTLGYGSLGKNVISSDGRFALFSVSDGVLISGDSNGYGDVFLVETGL